jgi:sec-independent protein translocase protein TatB
MIDLGLTKIALIGAVALVVIGPEKLPAVARMAGTLWGRAQRYMNTVKAEVNREMQMEELNKMHSGFMNATSKINQTISQSFSEVQQNLTEAGDSLTEAMAEANVAYTGYSEALRVPTDEDLAAKRRDFRKKKLSQTSSLPIWFKRSTGRKTRVMSGAARVARYRPNMGRTIRFFN